MHPATQLLTATGKSVRLDAVRVGDQLMGDDGTARTVSGVNGGTGTLVQVELVKGLPLVVEVSSSLRVQASAHLTLPFIAKYQTYRLEMCDWTRQKTKYLSFSIAKHDSKEKAFVAAEAARASCNTPASATCTIQHLQGFNQSSAKMLKLYRAPAVKFSSQPVLIDPYVLGAWLGDGDSSGSGFTNIDHECTEAMRKYMSTVGC